MIPFKCVTDPDFSGHEEWNRKRTTYGTSHYLVTRDKSWFMNYGSVKILKVVSVDRNKMDKGVNLAQKCYNYQMTVLMIGIISIMYQSNAITCAYLVSTSHQLVTKRLNRYLANATEPIWASLILNIAIREPLSSAVNIRGKFGPRSGPTKCLKLI